MSSDHSPHGATRREGNGLPAAGRPELLAPAGGPEALFAALANGADAVYLGVGDMNARRGAENFTVATLPDACRQAHLAGGRVYLTANIVVLPHEMTRALALAADAWEAGIDALIVQDLGFMDLLSRELPDIRVHASTQVNAHNSAMLDVLAGLDCRRVTLAREAPLADIARFSARPDGLEIEAFVHGSLCYCYSGQCLMSSMVGGRSANRGMCAQPCRLPYRLQAAGGGIAEVPGDYLLSPRDLCGIGQLAELVRCGVASLKIEGRMKAPEYVALVTGVYRAALDRAIADPGSFEVRDAELEILAEAFSRGFTDGYLMGEVGPEMMSYRRPNNRGVPLGRVMAEGARAVVNLDRSLGTDDRIEFWTRAGRFAQRAGALEVAGSLLGRAEAGAHVGIATEKPVRAGDRVFRVADADLLAAARRTWTSPDAGAVPVDMRVRLRVGEPLAIEAAAEDVVVRLEGALVEPARTRPATAQDVHEHTAGRVGGSGYTARDFELELDAGAGIGFSALHALRRDALEALSAARLKRWSGRRMLRPGPKLPRPADAALDGEGPRLVVLAEETARAGPLLDAGASIVLAERGVPGGPAASARRGAILPRIVTDAEAASVAEWTARAAGEAGPALTGNLGTLASLAAAGREVWADSGLNTTNPWTAAVLARAGARTVWLSPELSERQVAAVAAASPVPTGLVVFGRTELMVAENCVLAALGPCSRRCGSCRRRDEEWHLLDRKDYRLPVFTDSAGRSHVLNAVTLDLTKALPSIVAAGVRLVGVDVRGLVAAEAIRVVRRTSERLAAAVAGKDVDADPLVSPVTTGHFYRGVS